MIRSRIGLDPPQRTRPRARAEPANSKLRARGQGGGGARARARAPRRRRAPVGRVSVCAVHARRGAPGRRPVPLRCSAYGEWHGPANDIAHRGRPTAQPLSRTRARAPSPPTAADAISRPRHTPLIIRPWLLNARTGRPATPPRVRVAGAAWGAGRVLRFTARTAVAACSLESGPVGGSGRGPAPAWSSLRRRVSAGAKTKPEKV